MFSIGKVWTKDLYRDGNLTHCNSQIVTELQLPRSGILSDAEHMPWPNGPAAIRAGLSELQAQAYVVRLLLRRHTNLVIADLYSPGREDSMSILFLPSTLISSKAPLTERW